MHFILGDGFVRHCMCKLHLKAPGCHHCCSYARMQANREMRVVPECSARARTWPSGNTGCASIASSPSGSSPVSRAAWLAGSSRSGWLHSLNDIRMYLTHQCLSCCNVSLLCPCAAIL